MAKSEGTMGVFFASKEHVDGVASGNSNGTGSHACLIGTCKTCSLHTYHLKSLCSLQRN